MRGTGGYQEDGRWDSRLYPGVDVRSVPAETRSSLAQNLGILGVEAEYFLALARPFTSGGPDAPASREAGERFLWQLEASAHRLANAADGMEVATQAYLASLEADHPELRAGGSVEEPAPWWPDASASPLAGGSLEMGLRRCGYAYRHVVGTHLASHTQAIGEQMALVLHALSTLPPAGVLPLGSLHAGLYELAEAMQGDVVMRHLRDVSPEHPGVLTGIALLRQLDATQERSVEADVAWARGQLAELEALVTAHPEIAAAAVPPARRGLAALFRRGSATPTSALASSGTAAYLARARREWGETIASLEALGRPALNRQPSARR